MIYKTLQLHDIHVDEMVLKLALNINQSTIKTLHRKIKIEQHKPHI